MNEQNSVVDSLMVDENDQKLCALISIIWNHVFKLIGDHVAENSEEITFNLGRQHFTSAVAGLHEFFTGPDFSAYVCAIFSCEHPTSVQRSVIIQLSTHIFEEFLLHLLAKVRHDQESSGVPFKSGRNESKVRYVGGWAIHKIRLAYKVKKTAELRKKVQQRKEKQQEKADSVPFLVIYFNLLSSN